MSIDIAIVIVCLSYVDFPVGFSITCDCILQNEKRGENNRRVCFLSSLRRRIPSYVYKKSCSFFHIGKARY